MYKADGPEKTKVELGRLLFLLVYTTVGLEKTEAELGRLLLEHCEARDESSVKLRPSSRLKADAVAHAMEEMALANGDFYARLLAVPGNAACADCGRRSGAPPTAAWSPAVLC